MILVWLKWFVPHMLGQCPGYGTVAGQDCPICYWDAVRIIKRGRK